MAKCVMCGRELGALAFGKKVCRWCMEFERSKRGESKQEEYQRVMPTPWSRSEALGGVTFNQLFVGINLLVFLAMVGSGLSLMSGPNPAEMIRWGGNYGPLTLGGEPWRIVTYMFLHYGLIHFGFNMWCLWDLGVLAESMYGDWTFAIVYLLCGVGGGVASLWWNPASVSAGASGAIFGLAGALLASLKLGEFSLPRNMISGTMRSVVAFVGYNLVLGAMWGRTDNACHIGGLVTGVILGALIAVLAPDREGVAKRIGICLLVLVIIGGGGWWVERSRGALVVAQRGQMLLQHRKTDQAIAELSKAIRLHPEFLDARLELAQAYLMSGNEAAAESELREALRRDPKNAWAQYALGVTLTRRAQYDAAIPALEKAQELDGDSYEIEMVLADCYRAKGMKQQADEAQMKAAELQAQKNSN